MNTKTGTRSITVEYDLPSPPEHSGFVLDNASAFDGASKGWRRMIGERLGEVLAGL